MNSTSDRSGPDAGQQPVTSAVAESKNVTASAFSTEQLDDSFGDSEVMTGNEPPRIDLQPGTVIKHYELIRKLGAGGMGTVFLARDNRLGRLVAIKFLLERSGPAAARLLAEARMTARCRHDNIVVMYDVDEFDGRPYMALEYVEGRTLRAAMHGKTHTTVAGAVELMLPVARALACAHEMGIVHRDLKPENILLSDAGQVKVLDFGIAKQVSIGRSQWMASKVKSMRMSPTQLTQHGAIVGTMPYMSPEQWLDLPIDGRTDIWAVGLILFELMTGAHPLEPLTMTELGRVQDLDEPMPSVREKLLHAPELAQVIDQCLKKSRDERLRSAKVLVEALEQLDPNRRGFAVSEDSSPFAGLSAFQESDSARFFGRGDDIAALVGRLRQQQLVTVVGASGAGKSSFVRAGVIPALKRVGRDFETFIVRPGRQPFTALADVLAFLDDTSGTGEEADPAAIAETLRTQPGYLGARLRARCRKRGPNHRMLVFVDQLEELYTQGSDPAERAAFCACIEGVADDASSPLRVITTIRADFLDRVSEDRGFLTAMTRGLFFLPPMRTLGLRDALEKPLEAAGYRFEDDALRDEMLVALTGTKSPLPILQFTATQLWESRDRDQKRLTRAAYRALGGVAGALSTHADAVLAGLSRSEQRTARAIFTRLVTPERTRAVVHLDELLGLSDDAATIEHLVQILANARLLAIDAGGEREGKTVELTHESLIERWSKLRKWLDENEHDTVFLEELRNAATQWEKNDRADGVLWRDQAAMEAGQWLARRKAELGRDEALDIGTREIGYLEAVVRLSERTKRRRNQAIGGLIVFSSFVAVVVSLLAMQAKSEARRADAKAGEAESNALEAKKSADEAHKKAAEARNASRMASAREHLSNPTLVLALVRELEPADSLPPRWRELVRWAVAQDVAQVVLTHPDAVWSASFGPDGQRIVTACGDKAVRVWNADGRGEPTVLRGHDDIVVYAAFSSDGRRIVSASRDKTARVWSVDGTAEPLVLQGHTGTVWGASFSPDGRRIVTASLDKTVRVWNADGTGEPRLLEGHTDGVRSAAFSPDGKHIVTASLDKTARVWTVDGLEKPLVLEGHQDGVYSATYSPDGERIATASFDHTVRVWRANGEGKPILLEGQADRLRNAEFSPDGRRIVAASTEQRAYIWNADGTGAPLLLEGFQAMSMHATFSPDGQRIIIASWDKTARVWNADRSGKPVRLEGHKDSVMYAGFSPDGRRVLTASYDKTARVWNADGSGKPVLLEGHRDAIWGAAFSPDGRRVVTASQDDTARVWNADGTGQPLVLEGHRGVVATAAFSPDGQRIVTASYDKTARIWNADGTGKPLVLEGHEDNLVGAKFSPDGRHIVTASWDKTARVWNADGTDKPIVLEGHQAIVTFAAFSPDSQRIVTSSFDKTVRVWNADGQGKPLVLEGHQDIIATAEFSPDGRHIVTVSQDKTLRVWNADGTGEPAVLLMPDFDDANAGAFSPDGTRIVTASHNKPDPNSGELKHWATIWRTFEPLKSPNDPELWLATRYCPPVDLRVDLLAVSAKDAALQLAACEARVVDAFNHAYASTTR